MKYIRTKDGIKIVNIICNDQKHYCDSDWNIVEIGNNKIADTIEKLCDCFIKIKRKRGCKDFILKHDFRDLPLLREQKIKYPNSPVYGAINIDDKGLIYVAKMNEKGELELS